MPYKTGIRLLGVARNPANGFPARLLGALEDVDLLIQPTSAGPAAKMNLNPAKGSLEQAKRALVEGSFRSVYSLSGAPALSILCGFTSLMTEGYPWHCK